MQLQPVFEEIPGKLEINLDEMSMGFSESCKISEVKTVKPLFFFPKSKIKGRKVHILFDAEDFNLKTVLHGKMLQGILLGCD